MTPSGQSLGSVGMGGDSRCGTAPLQMTNGCPLGLDDLMTIPAGGSSTSSSQSAAANTTIMTANHNNNNNNNGRLVDNGGASGGLFRANNCSSPMDPEKNDILMGKLMMDSDSESLLQRSGVNHHDGAGELALALEEAEWKQQLDRGKSEHLANFLNEPMMNKQFNTSVTSSAPSSNQNLKNLHHHHNHDQQQDHQNPGANKMLSGGINPSDDENSPASNSPNEPSSDHQVNDFNNYLDCDVADNGSGLPPDDSILDLFER